MKKEYDLKKLKKRPEKAKVDSSASKIPISIRVDGSDLAVIKDEAERLGMPYQTFVNSILHQYAHGDLIERKTVEMLKKINV